MPRFVRLLVPAVLLVAGAVPASAGPRPVTPTVAPGYDLFLTPDGGGRIEIDAGIAGVPVMTFRGRSLGTFDFGQKGPQRVGKADTIVRRLDTATPASPRVRIELVGLLLESTNVPGYFVTPQSIRPLGLPSTGTLDFGFGRTGTGGILRSELMVNYDVRHGSPTGPIVATGSTGMGFVADNIVWSHDSRSTEDRECIPNYCVTIQDNSVCHEAGFPAPPGHLHCVEFRPSVIPLISGVNHRLNGRDTGADFHPVGTGTRT